MDLRPWLVGAPPTPLTVNRKDAVVLERLRPHEDDGLTMVETVVAMLVFGLFAGFAARLMVDVTSVSRGNAQRLVAGNLAAQHVEQLRGTGALKLPDGRSVAPEQPVIGGTTYTITRDVRFVASQSGTSVCAGTADTLAYKLVTVEVTWPRMGSTRPVRSDTLRTVGIGKNAADVKRGTLAVEVLRADGTPHSGVTVTVTPGPLTAVTGTDGCVVFPNLATSSTYSATLDAFPFVNRQGAQRSSRTGVSLTAGKVTKVQMSYERRGAIAANPVAPTGYPVPADLVVSLDASILTPTTTRVFNDCATVSTSPQNCVSGSPRTAAALFPAVYRVWPDSCAMPSGLPGVTVTSDTTASTNLALGGLQVLILDSASPLRQNTLYAFRRTSSSCSVTASYVMSTLSPGERRLALPPGSWDIVTTADGTGTTSFPTQTVTAGAVTTVSQ